MIINDGSKDKESLKKLEEIKKLDKRIKVQDEKDIYNFEYNNEEVNLYINAIEQVIKNIEKYKENSRKRILNGFTLKNMAENMGRIFEELVDNPNQQKIENGKALSKMLGITKELIVANLISDSNKMRWQSEEYQKEVYGKIYSFDDENSYKKEIWKEKLWSISLYRYFVKTVKKIWRKIK